MMPRSIENTVGWLALKLRMGQLQQQQQLEADKVQWERETQSRSQAQVPAIIQAGLQDERLREMSTQKADQSLRIAEMNNATRLAINEQTTTLRKLLGERGLDLKDKGINVNDENTDNKLVQDNQIAANKLEQDKSEELGRNARNTQNVTQRYAGIQNTTTGEMPYSVETPPGVTQAPPMEPGALNKKERGDLTHKAAAGEDKARKLEDFANMIEKIGKDEDFGLAGSSVVNVNKAADVYGQAGTLAKMLGSKAGVDINLPGATTAQEGSERRNAIRSQGMNYLMGVLREEIGAAQTDSEAARVLNSIGITVNKNGDINFDPFTQDRKLVIQSARQFAENMRSQTAVDKERITKGNVFVQGTGGENPSNPDKLPVTPMPAVPIPDQPKQKPGGEITEKAKARKAELKKMWQSGKITEQQALKALAQEFPELFDEVE